MSAYVYLSGSKHAALTLPVDAVIRDAKGATVWIQIENLVKASKQEHAVTA